MAGPDPVLGYQPWKMKITVEIDDHLLQRVERHVARERLTLATMIEDALRASLPPQPSVQRPRRFRPPVVRGDAQPTVDVADRSALYDLFDSRE